MSQKTDAVVINTIGIDTGKNTLHLVGLDDQGTIVLREKLASGLQHTAGAARRIGSHNVVRCEL
jgi:hypothetical protein